MKNKSVKREQPFTWAVLIWIIAVTALLVLHTAGMTAIKRDLSMEKDPVVVYTDIPIQGIAPPSEGTEQESIPYYYEIASSITEQEIELLACATYLEAGNQSLVGQRAVVEVILNRVLSDKFPNTIAGVLFQQGQFATAENVPIAVPTEKTYQAIQLTLETTTPILEPHVVFFARGVADWQTAYEKIGAHYFCYLKEV